ncbi:C2H2-type domain-containing protein [Trichoderma simmonsii]|uniref:C2H2-type domain-containing protein n=1 Tax=Trichoderma simmonsii TaxID=1491479 RepID=A0A8G0PJK2_9HYPO|nr:C2H2-type domain-containing protein [Trichoderma simmonsii]
MDTYMTNYPQDMGWDSTMPVDPEMSTEPAPFNTDDDNFDDEVEISSTVSFNDPSSEMNPAGEHRPGYRWCCDEWKKHDGNFKKHLNTHNKQVPCEAGCFERFADNKARNRHYWVSHKKYAKENNIPNEKCFCEPCGKSFSRRDNFRRHVDNHHSHEAEGGGRKMVIDDKYETIECEDGEYARICRLRNIE